MNDDSFIFYDKPTPERKQKNGNKEETADDAYYRLALILRIVTDQIGVDSFDPSHPRPNCHRLVPR